ncbi:MAG: hypothetical protein V1667_00940 [bacterium]
MTNETRNKIDELKEAIIKVIAFFDMFDYALTDWEIWRMLGVQCEFFEVVEKLEEMHKSPLPPLVKGGENGFYFLPGREKNIIERLNRYNFADRKFKRAVFVSKFFRFIPWVKMIAVGNLLGAHNLKDGSDIDFFIIAEDKRIWLARFFCAGIAKIAGWRPKNGDSRDKICLSFYASAGAMDLSGLMMKGKETNPPYPPLLKGAEFVNPPYPPLLKGAEFVNPPYPPLLKGAEFVDIYFIYWLAGLSLVYDAGGIYEKFLSANSWLKNYLPNWRLRVQSPKRRVKPFLSEFYHDAADLLIGGLEPQFKKLQIKFLPLKLKNLMNKDTRVVVDDKIIKLHANDRREEYAARHEEKMRLLRRAITRFSQ